MHTFNDNKDSVARLFQHMWAVKYETYGDSVDIGFEERGNVLYIYLEASDEISDWVLNFVFTKKPYKDMEIPYKVHSGFLKCWKSIEDVVIAKIKPIMYKQIIIMGYSHGAALAMLCHECVWYHRPDLRSTSFTIAIDGPRVYAGFKVKKELKERWERFYLIRTGSDVVTHVPPKLFGYTHVGTVIELGKKNIFRFIKDHYPDVIMNAIKERENLPL